MEAYNLMVKNQEVAIIRRQKNYKRNPYRKSKMQFLRPYIPKGFYWTTFKFRQMFVPACDANGVLAYAVGIWSLQGNQKLWDLADFYQSYKIVYCNFEIAPTPALGMSTEGSTGLIATVTHLDMATILAGAYRDNIMKSRKYYTLPGSATDKSLKLRWICDPSDGDENQFTRLSAGATGSANGGLLLHYDGSNVMNGRVPFSITVTWYCVLRGDGCINLN